MHNTVDVLVPWNWNWTLHNKISWWAIYTSIKLILKKVHEMNCCETAIAHTLNHKLYRVMHFYWSFLSTEPSIEVILTDILITIY